MQVAVIGTGIAGAALGACLVDTGAELVFFEKARGIGGRLSTRYTGDYQFDHGAPFFTARSSAFREFLQPFIDNGTVMPWDAKVTTLGTGKKPYGRPWFEPHYVSTPRMNGLCKLLLAEHKVMTGVEVTSVEGGPAEWYVVSEGGRYGPFSIVVSTAPAEQTVRLFEGRVPDILKTVDFDPVFALMGEWHAEVPGWDAAVVRDSPLSWLAFTQTKPGRSCRPSLVAHATSLWSRKNFSAAMDVVLDTLAEEIKAQVGKCPGNPVVHRWRYAHVKRPLGEPFWFDSHTGLAACGDWCIGDGVEVGYQSALALAEALAAGAGQE